MKDKLSHSQNKVNLREFVTNRPISKEWLKRVPERKRKQ
jgi:hypothetical protein